MYDRQSEKDGKERDRIHREMLSSFSHDLRTPLASIISSLQAYEHLGDQLPLEKKRALIGIALQEAHRLDRFITNIGDMARLEKGLVTVARETVDIGHFLRDCVKNLSNRLQGSTVEIKAAPPLAAMTDPVLLGRVVGLMLENAVYHGGMSPIIHIAFGRDEDQRGFINVQDKGSGSPLARVEAVFSKDGRLGKSEETGLGLAISRAMMALLEGDIAAENHADGGALFTLRFPLR